MVHYDRAVFLPLFHPLDVDGLFLKVNVRKAQGDDFADPKPQKEEKRDRERGGVPWYADDLTVDFLLHGGYLVLKEYP